MSVINTNITSMIAQQNLNDSKGALETNMERLSSGLRINSAKDDAAGQAIANRFEAQTTGLAQAQRNANDGISAAQTAEGALDQINDNVQRVRELTVQAANGTNSEKDLTSIQDEIGQRLNEIDRISEQTDFNGTKVLDEGVSGLDIQVGANDGETITVNLEQVNAETLDLKGFNVDGQEVNNDSATLKDIQSAVGNSASTSTNDAKADFAVTTQNEALSASDVFSNLDSGDVDYTGTNNGFNVAADSDTYSYDAKSDSFTFDVAGATGNTGNASDVASAVTPNSGSVEATYEQSGGSSVDVVIDSAGNITNEDGNTMFIGEDGNLSQNDGGNSNKATVDSLMTAFDAGKTSGGTTANFNTGGTLTLNSGEQEGLELTSTADTKGVDIANARISADDLVAASVAEGTAIDATVKDDGSTTALDINDGTVVSDSGTVGTDDLYRDGEKSSFATTGDESFNTDVYEQDDGTFNAAQDGNGAELYATQSGDLTFDAKTTEGRTADPLETLDGALNKIDSMRSDLGAIQNRFESAITNLSTNETNLSDAQSRIEDVDYASEVAEMTKNQILQQAGTSVLAQANQLPQNALSLLG